MDWPQILLIMGLVLWGFAMGYGFGKRKAFLEIENIAKTIADKCKAEGINVVDDEIFKGLQKEQESLRKWH